MALSAVVNSEPSVPIQEMPGTARANTMPMTIPMTILRMRGTSVYRLMRVFTCALLPHRLYRFNVTVKNTQ